MKINFFKVFCLFFLTSLHSQATSNYSELTVDNLTIALVITWIVTFVVIVKLMLSRNKYKKAALLIAEENEELEKIKNKVLEVEKMDLLKAIEKFDEMNNKILKLESQKEKLDDELLKTTNQLNKQKEKLEAVNDELNMESFALYKPKYDFANSSQYKFKLEEIRKNQKEMIKSKKAVHYSKDWTINGSASEGRKMTNNNIKMILRSFNSDCEAAINKIKFSNLERIENRIYKSFEQLNKLNEVNQVSITQEFLNLKFDELHLGYEYEQKLR